jgi:hypothetical protein
MAYETGTPTSAIDLLQKLVAFLSANAWTTDKSASVGFGWEAHLHKGSVYAHFRAAVGERSWSSFNEADAGGSALNMFLSGGFDGSGAWDAQPGNPPKDNSGSFVIGAGMNLSYTTPPFANYYFFTDSTDDNVVVVLERSSGVYLHLFWGPSIVKNGSWTGGMYFGSSTGGYYASYRFAGVNTPGFTSTGPCPGCQDDAFGLNPSFVRCDADSFTGKWIGIGDNTGGGQGYTGRSGASSVGNYSTSLSNQQSIVRYATSPFSPTTNPQQFQFGQTSQIDGRVNLLPILWWAGRDGSSANSGGFSPIGTLPMIFATNGVGNGFTPTGEYTIGPDTYMMFPHFAVLKVV